MSEQLTTLNQNSDKEDAFRIFMDKMNLAEKSVQDNGYYSEDEVEKNWIKYEVRKDCIFRDCLIKTLGNKESYKERYKGAIW